MSKAILPDQEYLRQCFEYNSDTGVLTWKVRPLSHFKNSRACSVFNSRFSGRQITAADSHGYLQVKIRGRQYLASRVIWKWLHGVDPVVIDHIDGRPLNNREVNLRNVTRSQNMKNKGTYRRADPTLPKGVSLRDTKSGVRYLARIRAGGKQKHLGTYTTLGEANAAYQAAADKYFGEFKRVA